MLFVLAGWVCWIVVVRSSGRQLSVVASHSWSDCHLTKDLAAVYTDYFPIRWVINEIMVLLQWKLWWIPVQHLLDSLRCGWMLRLAIFGKAGGLLDSRSSVQTSKALRLSRMFRQFWPSNCTKYHEFIFPIQKIVRPGSFDKESWVKACWLMIELARLVVDHTMKILALVAILKRHGGWFIGHWICARVSTVDPTSH